MLVLLLLAGLAGALTGIEKNCLDYRLKLETLQTRQGTFLTCVGPDGLRVDARELYRAMRRQASSRSFPVKVHELSVDARNNLVKREAVQLSRLFTVFPLDT